VSEVACAAERLNILGEGPCWDDASGRLYWLDIHGRLLEWLRPSDGASGSWKLELRASTMALRDDGTLLLAAERGLAVFDPGTGELELRMALEGEPSGNRTNDGHADAQGRFWVGTMDDSEQATTGSVYRIGPDWSCRRVIEGLAISNIIITSPDGKILYVADSKAQTIWAYPLDPATGDLGERRVFVDSTGDKSAPDGAAVDAEGCLWNARWGGWRIERRRPDGTLDRKISVPVSQPTSCCFGGEGLRTLYITSARKGLSEEALAKQPLAGSLFAVDVGVAGHPQPLFGG
jgi:sugar lactone lactonase YvrE